MHVKVEQNLQDGLCHTNNAPLLFGDKGRVKRSAATPSHIYPQPCNGSALDPKKQTLPTWEVFC